jgi:hypothetical protein
MSAQYEGPERRRTLLTREDVQEIIASLVPLLEVRGQAKTMAAEWSSKDHDLLVRINTLLEGMERDLKEHRRDVDERFRSADGRLQLIERTIFTAEDHIVIKDAVKWSQEFRAQLVAFKWTIWIGSILGGAGLGQLVNWFIFHSGVVVR